MMKPGQIASQTRLSRWIALLAITGLGLYLCWKIVEPFVTVIVLGVVVVMIFSPLHNWFLRKTKRPTLSALFSTLCALLVIVLPTIWVTMTLAKELPTAVETLRNGAEGLRTSWDKANEEGGWVADLRKSYNLDQFLTPEKLKEYSTTVSDTLVKQLFTIVGGLVGMLVQFVFLIFTIFFLFRDRDKIASLVPDFLPLERDQSAALTARTKEVVHACVYGVLFVASVQGLLGGIIFWLLGMSSPVVWGVVMTLLCTLPIVGAWVVWMPAAIGLALHGDYTKAVVLLLLGQFVISSIDGVIRPIVVGQRAKLHELLIFFSVLGGLRYFGIIGILIGPVVMAITYVLINSLWRVQKRREGEPQIIPG